MFLQLKHQKLDVFQSARHLTVECYKISMRFPSDERFNMVQQIRRAAASVVLNIAEGASRKSATERKRYFEVSRGSLIEIDAAFDVAHDLGYFADPEVRILEELMNKTFGMLSNLINR